MLSDVAKLSLSFRHKVLDLNAAVIAINHFAHNIDILCVENNYACSNQVLNLLKWLRVFCAPIRKRFRCFCCKSIRAFCSRYYAIQVNDLVEIILKMMYEVFCQRLSKSPRTSVFSQ